MTLKRALSSTARILSPWWTAGRSLTHAAHRGSPALTATAAGGAALLLVSLLLTLIDSRQVLGASTWLKPTKFALSVVMNALAMAAIIGHLAAAAGGAVARGLRRASAVMAAMLILELSLIVFQAARGVPSHFNAATAFDGAIFQIMGAGISLFWLAQVYVTWRAFRQSRRSAATNTAPSPTLPPRASPLASPLSDGIRLGLLVAVLGGALGFLMSIPTAPQRAQLKTGQPTAALGAHAVGVPDGGPGLPVTRWSTTGGDLRIPHFLGLHALQVLPLLGFMLARRRKRGRFDLMRPAGIAYLGLVLTTLVQALRGQPLLAPDGLTLATLATTLAAAVAPVFVRAASPVNARPTRTARPAGSVPSSSSS